MKPAESRSGSVYQMRNFLRGLVYPGLDPAHQESRFAEQILEGWPPRRPRCGKRKRLLFISSLQVGSPRRRNEFRPKADRKGEKIPALRQEGRPGPAQVRMSQPVRIARVPLSLYVRAIKPAAVG
jgi:hypothetical protein